MTSSSEPERIVIGHIRPSGTMLLTALLGGGFGMPNFPNKKPTCPDCGAETGPGKQGRRCRPCRKVNDERTIK